MPPLPVDKPDNAEPTNSEVAGEHPRAYLAAHVVVGFLLAVGAAWAFAAVAEDLPEKGSMIRVDNAVTTWLQTHGTETGEAIFAGISLLGSPVLWTVLVVSAIMLVRTKAWRRLVALAVTCGGGALLNIALKTLFHRTRPTFANEFHAHSWSFPSAHAMNSLIAYGFLATLAAHIWPERRSVLYPLAAALIVSIGFSRIYLGVHYLSDVVAGYCAGLVWLSVCVTGFRFAHRRHIGIDVGGSNLSSG